MTELSREQVEQYIEQLENWTAFLSQPIRQHLSALRDHDATLRARLGAVERERDDLRIDRDNAVDMREGSLMRIDGLKLQLAAVTQERDRLRSICEEATEEVIDYANIALVTGKPAEPSLPESIRQMKRDLGIQLTAAQGHIKQLELINFDHETGFHAAQGEITRLGGRVQELEAELDKAIYLPGSWKCTQCEFGQVNSYLYMQSGTVGPNTDAVPCCPNDRSLMRRVTLKELVKDNDKYIIEMLNERDALTTRLAQVEEALKARRLTIEASLAAEVLADNSVKCAIERAALVEIEFIEQALLPPAQQKKPCPYCDNVGWTVQPHPNTGEPSQVQCQWCYERHALPPPAQEER